MKPFTVLAEVREAAADRVPPLSDAAEARHQRVLSMLTGGRQYAVYVEDPNSDPVILAVATPDGTCEIRIPQDRYDPFAVLTIVADIEAGTIHLKTLEKTS